MKKQAKQFGHGNSVIERVNVYCKTWEGRCYHEGIPEEVPDKLAKTLRVPSYKAIAMAILKNDLNFYSLGLPQRESEILTAVVKEYKK
jgi:predicted phosphoadenosine phosphosulfate sulfurtransferase